MKNRIVLLVLVSMIVLSLMAGCTAVQTPASAPTAKPTTAASEPEKEEIKQERPYKILWWQALEGVPHSSKDSIIAQKIMEITGIQFDWELNPGGEDYDTKLNLYMASGNMPDVFYATGAQKYANLRKWKEQGAIMPLKDLLEKYGQDILKVVSKETLNYVTFDGDIWGIPEGSRPEPGNGPDVNGLLARWDWVEKLGFAEIAMSEDFDLDQYYQLIKAMTFNDPDGNGQDDTYGLIEQ